MTDSLKHSAFSQKTMGTNDPVEREPISVCEESLLRCSVFISGRLAKYPAENCTIKKPQDMLISSPLIYELERLNLCLNEKRDILWWNIKHPSWADVLPQIMQQITTTRSAAILSGMKDGVRDAFIIHDAILELKTRVERDPRNPENAGTIDEYLGEIAKDRSLFCNVGRSKEGCSCSSSNTRNECVRSPISFIEKQLFCLSSLHTLIANKRPLVAWMLHFSNPEVAFAKAWADQWNRWSRNDILNALGITDQEAYQSKPPWNELLDYEDRLANRTPPSRPPYEGLAEPVPCESVRARLSSMMCE